MSEKILFVKDLVTFYTFVLIYFSVFVRALCEALNKMA